MLVDRKRILGTANFWTYRLLVHGVWITVLCRYISFRLEIIPPRGGVSHTDPSSSLLSVTSMFFLQSAKLHILLASHRFFCRPRLRRPLASAVIILFMQFSSSLLITPYHLNLASRILSVIDAPFLI